jgi:hypothetical protein
MMNSKIKEHALIAANDIADLFMVGFCNDVMVDHFASVIETQMELLGDIPQPDVYKLRDHIAITAMNGLMIGKPAVHCDSDKQKYTAYRAYQYADVMLKERNTQTVKEKLEMLLLIEDIIADLKLRASLSEEPDVLNISSSLLIRADKLIAKVRGEE